MFDFLITLFDWFGSFAMLFLGISFVEPAACDSVPELLPIQYQLAEIVEAAPSSTSSDCASFELDLDEEPVRIYRI